MPNRTDQTEDNLPGTEENVRKILISSINMVKKIIWTKFSKILA